MNLPILDTSCKWDHNICPLVSGLFHFTWSSGFIHVVAEFRSFLRLYNIPLPGCAMFYLSFHQLMGTGLFPHLAAVNNAAPNMAYRCLAESLLSVPLGIYLGVESSNHMVIVCVAFWGTAKESFSHHRGPCFLTENIEICSIFSANVLGQCKNLSIFWLTVLSLLLLLSPYKSSVT